MSGNRKKIWWVVTGNRKKICTVYACSWEKNWVVGVGYKEKMDAELLVPGNRSIRRMLVTRNKSDSVRVIYFLILAKSIAIIQPINSVISDECFCAPGKTAVNMFPSTLIDFSTVEIFFSASLPLIL